MRFTITGRNIEVTAGLREAVEDKLENWTVFSHLLQRQQ